MVKKLCDRENFGLPKRALGISLYLSPAAAGGADMVEGDGAGT